MSVENNHYTNQLKEHIYLEAETQGDSFELLVEGNHACTLHETR
jgi:hypothetical protein